MKLGIVIHEPFFISSYKFMVTLQSVENSSFFRPYTSYNSI